MKRSRPALIFQLLWTLIGLLYAPSAHAWGCKGHQTVAMLAEKHLTPPAKQMLLALLQDNPIDTHIRRFCGTAGLDDFADASTWADDFRSAPEGKPTAPWHFLDISLGATRSQVPAACGPDGCVTQAILDQLAILKDKTAPAPKRADALRFLIHFVGDLHQPLHTETNSDRGGNCVPVAYFRRKPSVKNNEYTPNLHHIWDTEILERQMQGADAAEYADTLDAKFGSSFAAWQQGGMQLEDWAWEGHQQAVSVGYGALSPKIAIEPNVPVNTCADNNNIGQRMLKKHIAVGVAYQAASGPLIDMRLAQAGIRLAMILNDAAK